MRRPGMVIFGVASLLAGILSAWAGSDRPIVAVFEIQDETRELSEEQLLNYSEDFAALVDRDGVFRTIYPSAIRKTLALSKQDSLLGCNNRPCWIQAGRALGATKILITTLHEKQGQCTFRSILLDLNRNAPGLTRTIEDSCVQESLVFGLLGLMPNLIAEAASEIRGWGGGSKCKADGRPTIDAEEFENCGYAALLGYPVPIWIARRPGAVEFTGEQITVAQYVGCVAAGRCAAPATSKYDWKCNWGVEGRSDDPINCIEANQAVAFCQWASEHSPKVEWIGMPPYHRMPHDNRLPWEWGLEWMLKTKSNRSQTFMTCDARMNPDEIVMDLSSCELMDESYSSIDAGFRCARLPQSDEQKPISNLESKKNVYRGLKWVYSKPANVEFTKSEITVAQYEECSHAGKCTYSFRNTPSKFCNMGRTSVDELLFLDHPINCISWNEAREFCAWAGGRLPAEQEWEAEATNTGQRRYPWGDEQVTCDYASWGEHHRGCNRDSTWPVCSKPNGNSVSGLCDLFGNVSEWTSSGESSVWGYRHVSRGGSWCSGNLPYEQNTSYRTALGARARSVMIGFRCARSPKGF